MGAGCSENIMFMCMNTQEHHVPTTPMGVPTWEHDVSPKKCDVNIGGRGGGKGGERNMMPSLGNVTSSNMNVAIGFY
jgi:hypothetical protein